MANPIDFLRWYLHVNADKTEGAGSDIGHGDRDLLSSIEDLDKNIKPKKIKPKTAIIRVLGRHKCQTDNKNEQ